jgi:hypothetical protein
MNAHYEQMGMLSRLWGRRPETRHPASSQPIVRRIWSDTSARFGEYLLYEGRHDVEIVGESNYQDALWSAVGGRTTERVRAEIRAVLAAEPDNPHDSNAISVWIDGNRSGISAVKTRRRTSVASSHYRLKRDVT